MFDSEILELTASLREALNRANIPYPEQIKWNPAPFRGRWGIGTAVAFQAAALEKAEGGVQERAREIAAIIARPAPATM